MAPPVYKYLCGIELSSIEVTVDDVPNLEVKALIEEVKNIHHLYISYLAFPPPNGHVFIPVMVSIAIFSL